MANNNSCLRGGRSATSRVGFVSDSRVCTALRCYVYDTWLPLHRVKGSYWTLLLRVSLRQAFNNARQSDLSSCTLSLAYGCAAYVFFVSEGYCLTAREQSMELGWRPCTIIFFALFRVSCVWCVAVRNKALLDWDYASPSSAEGAALHF